MPTLDGFDPRAVQQAARRLAAGELLAFPTETVYGLGARADDDAAVARIFAAKGRPAEHPLIVHVADAAAAAPFTAALEPAARALIEAFWPGPLTVIVPRAAGIARAAAGGQGSIGLRSPSHPVAQALLRAAALLGVPGVAAPSANRYGRVSATSAAHVADEFGPDLWLLDGGVCPLGIESSILDCSRAGAAPVLLRPGVLTLERIEQVLFRATGRGLRERDEQSPRASGTLAAHYAPAAEVRLMAADTLRSALAGRPAGGSPPRLAVYSQAVFPVAGDVVHRAMPLDAASAAHELFSVLRDFDAAGMRSIWIEQPPSGPDWEGVRDRLSRAAAAHSGAGAAPPGSTGNLSDTLSEQA